MVKPGMAGNALDSVIMTSELHSRPCRQPDYQKEREALLSLARHLADAPDTILDKLTEACMQCLDAGSGGISLISEDSGDFYWPSIAGAWASYIGEGTPREFGPCGVVLDRQKVELFVHPERYYPYLQGVEPVIEEVLLCPFFLEGVAVGTVWAVSHDPQRKFDAEDSRLLTSLSAFAAAAFQNQKLRKDLSRQHEALMKAEKRMRALADTAPAMLWLSEPDGQCSFVSHGWCVFTGQTEEEAMGKGWQSVVHPDDVEPTRAKFNEAYEKRELIDADYRVKTGEGVYRWVTDSGRPRFDESGEFLGFIGAVIDVHDSKENTRSLREREEQLRRTHAELQALYDQSPIGLVQFDKELRFVRINKALAAMNGVPVEDHIGRMVHEILPELGPKVEEDFRHILKTGEPIIDIELKGQTAADPGVEHIWLESWFPLRDESGEVVGLNVVAQDITSRKRAEERLQLLSETVAKLLQARDPDLIVRELFADVAAHLNVDTYFNFMVNDKGDALKLHSCAGIPIGTAQSINRLEFGQAICGTVAQIREAIYAADIQHSDYDKAALVRSFGIQSYACNPLMVGDKLLGTLSFASRTRAAFDAEELKFMRVIAQYTAIALERLQTETEMVHARQQAEASSMAKDKFIAVLSHELRTPLTPVLATVSTLASDPTLPDAVRSDIDLIRRNVELEARLIDDLLDLSRITSGKLRLQMEAVDLGVAIQQASETCRPFIDDKKLELVCELPPQSLYVEADPARLQQVLWNLLRNATKFTPRNGRITVRLMEVPGNADRVQLQVQDTGRGISSDFQARIFDAFEQGSAEVPREFGGMGLGLAITKAILEMHHGSIQVSSDGVNKGATFTIELPKVIPVTVQAESTPSNCLAPADVPLKLLVVEDHEDTALVLIRLLKSRGYAVQAVNNVKDALELVERESFDVVVSDIGLPDASGYELMTEVRARYGDKIKGVAMSGFGMDEDIRKSREAGFSDHIVKPLNITQLNAAIRKAAGR